MKIKYIIKATARTRSLFLVRDVETFGNVVPFAFRDCEQQEWKIAKFAAQEELLRANIEKLSYELDELSKSSDPLVVDRASKIAGIASSIATVLGLFTK